KKGSFTGAINDKIGKFELAVGGTLFLGCISNGKSPMSCKNKVPPSANSYFRILSLMAPVHDHFLCLNNSLAINSLGMAEQLTFIKGLLLRELLLCMALANNSFPVPDSPNNNTVAFVGATFSTSLSMPLNSSLP